MHYLFLNQYFPPDPAPTGLLLAELAEELRRAGHTVECISAAHAYRPGQGKQGRWRRELGGLWEILRAGLRARRAEVVLSATSPPLLLVLATFIAFRHRAKSVHWVMDLYPEIAVALGEVKPGLFASLLRAVIGWCYRHTDCVIALDADMAERLAQHHVRAEIVRPWVFAPVIRWIEETEPPSPHPAGRPWIWIYSGNLGRAHEWETLLEAQRLLEQADARITLVFQGGGPSRLAAQARARELGLQRCHWRDYAEPEAIVQTLLACQLGVVTQLPVTRGLLWPSKLGLLLSLPRPILFIGDPAGAIAAELRQLPQAGVFSPGEARPVADWILHLQRTAPAAPEPALNPAAERTASLTRLRTLLESLNVP